MRRNILLILSACSLIASCGQQLDQQDWSKPDGGTISLSCKANNADGELMIWPATSSVGLFCPQTESYNVALNISAASAGTDNGRFYTQIPWGDGPHDFTVYYPFSETVKEGYIAGSLNSTISGGESAETLNKNNTFVGTLSTSRTDVEGDVEITMAPLFDVCSIAVSNTKYTDCKLERISVKTKSGNTLSGKWEYEISTKLLSYTEPSDMLTINLASVSLIETTEAYFLTYKSTDLSEDADWEVTLSKGDGSVALKGEARLCASTLLDLDSFTSTVIEDNSINLADIDNDGIVETANCYVVPQANKTYRFPATIMGNGKTLPADEAYAPSTQGSAPGITPAALNPLSAQVLWQTGSSLITNVKLNKGHVYFNLNGDSSGNLIPGNAVIAVYSGANCSGVILWSWHLWITDADLDANLQTWKVNSSLSAYSAYQDPKLMDRNLGALSSSDWKASGTNWSKGLNYQWGRKDPFVGPDNASMTSRVAVQTYNAAGQPINQTVAAASAFSNAPAWTHVDIKLSREDIAKYPMAFVSGASNHFWMEEVAHDLWGCPGYADNSNNIGQKTIYDPCPPGYRVMNAYAMSGVTSTAAGGALANLTHSVQNVSTYRANGEDLIVRCNDTEYATLPACGLVYYEKAQNFFPFDRMGTYGYMWSAKMTSTSSYKAYRMHYDWNYFVSMETAYASYGHNVRCEKIK